MRVNSLIMLSFPIKFIFLIPVFLALGCAGRQAVIAVTATVIGVEISQNPANQSPQAKLGYNRGEIAIVPTNRSANEEAGTQLGGATDVADVLMEIRYGGIFDVGATSGIYQRLAVGSNAVVQPGASLMFAKDASGNISDKTADAIKSLQSVATANSIASKELLPLSRAFGNGDATTRTAFDAAAKATGVFNDFTAFATNRPRQPTVGEIQAVRKSLESQGYKF